MIDFSQMSQKRNTVTRWIATLVLLGCFLWSLNLAAFNWWASGGPPVQHPEIYRQRGNLFFGISGGLLVACILCLRSLIRNTKTQRRTLQ